MELSGNKLGENKNDQNKHCLNCTIYSFISIRDFHNNYFESSVKQNIFRYITYILLFVAQYQYIFGFGWIQGYSEMH